MQKIKPLLPFHILYILLKKKLIIILILNLRFICYPQINLKFKIPKQFFFLQWLETKRFVLQPRFRFVCCVRLADTQCVSFSRAVRDLETEKVNCNC